jgi:hypothetical protein
MFQRRPTCPAGYVGAKTRWRYVHTKLVALALLVSAQAAWEVES